MSSLASRVVRLTVFAAVACSAGCYRYVDGTCYPTTTLELALAASNCDSLYIEATDLASLDGVETFTQGIIRLHDNEQMADVSQLPLLWGEIYAESNDVLEEAEFDFANAGYLHVSGHRSLREVAISVGANVPEGEPANAQVLMRDNVVLEQVRITCATVGNCRLNFIFGVVETAAEMVVPTLLLDRLGGWSLTLENPVWSDAAGILDWPMPEAVFVNTYRGDAEDVERAEAFAAELRVRGFQGEFRHCRLSPGQEGDCASL